jgi:ParB family chromosome partitioning protein
VSIRDKAKKLDFSALPQVGVASQAPTTPSPTVDLPFRAKTAPGAMMAFANDQRSDLLLENERLRQQASESADLKVKLEEASLELTQWEGAKASRTLDPARIRRSRWANRHEHSFSDSDFELLRQEIANAGGNVQPIKVRRVNDAPYEFEIIFGHRRHQACLELGLPVLALVDNVSDVDLFVEMDRENRSRKDLAPWEQGLMYRRALNQGLFPSNRKLAETVGVDLSAVGKALALADLPLAVIEAFPSPLELQYRWAKPLADALAADPEGVFARLSQFKESNVKRSAKDVLDCIVNASSGGGTVPPPSPIALDVAGARATVSMSSKGKATVEFDSGVVSMDRLRDLAKVIEAFLEKKARR